MKYDKNLENSEIKKILYDNREKNLIRKMIECPSKKIVCIVGMGHLDGIEKYWQDVSFWQDIEYWQYIREWEYDKKQKKNITIQPAPKQKNINKVVKNVPVLNYLRKWVKEHIIRRN